MTTDNTVPESLILINDVEVTPELRVDILEVVVAQHVEGGDAFDITVNALGVDDLQLKWIDTDEFTPGNKIEIKMGYEGNYESLMVGEITAIKARYPSDDAAMINVQGFDKLHRLRRGKKTRTFIENKDSQIAETIASELGLIPDVQDTQVVHKYLLQNNLSDIDFLLMRAHRIRYEVIVQNQTLIFREAANADGETLKLEYQRNLKWFSTRLSTSAQTSKYIVRGWNPETKEAIVGIGSSGDETTVMGGTEIGPASTETAFDETASKIVNLPIQSQAEADQVAKAKFNDMALGFMCGEGESVGNVALKAGTTIELAGLGERFSGPYYVKKAEHRISAQTGYVTKFNVERNAS